MVHGSSPGCLGCFPIFSFVEGGLVCAYGREDLESGEIEVSFPLSVWLFTALFIFLFRWGVGTLFECVWEGISSMQDCSTDASSPLRRCVLIAK